MEEAHSKYVSIYEMVDSMPCELKWMFLGTISTHPRILFMSKNKDELQRHLTDPSIPIARTRVEIDRDVTCWLDLLCEENYLLQIWEPVTIGDKRYLTTSDQIFALRELVKGLCSYRKHCLDYLIPIDDDPSTEGGLLLGPPGRVARNAYPEVCFDVSQYTSIEFPLREKAVACGIYHYMAFPLDKCGGVVELVCDEPPPKSWRDFRLVFANPSEFLLGSPTVVPEIEDMLPAVCRTHQLPLAQAWASIPDSRYKNEAVRCKGAFYAINDDFNSDDEEGSCIVDYDYRDFLLACHFTLIKKGQGVVGKAFSSKGASFCKDISQLSIDEYPLVPNARHAGLTGCFAISLTHRGCCVDCLYVVEFFIDRKTQSGDPRTLIQMLLATMKVHFKNFSVASGQELGENLFVEVIKTSPTDELDCFETCGLTGIDDTLSELEIAHRGGAGRDHERGANVFPTPSNLNQHGEEVVLLVDATGDLEQRDTSCKILENQRAIKRIQRDHGITRADLLQHSWKKQKDAAAHFRVSRSTFKRICREHQIFRWPPKTKDDGGPSKIAQEFVQPTEEIMKDSCAKELPLPVQPVEHNLKSKQDSIQNAMTGQNDSSIAIKVGYGDDIIRFNLSVSSGKIALEEEIAKRFHLSIGSFSVKYLDEDKEWILVTCDEDLNTCISIMRSLGKNTVKMSVSLSQDN